MVHGPPFFIAALFAARSLGKRGPETFVKERLFRLGIPLLLYVFVIDPFIGYSIMNYGDVRSAFTPIQAFAAYLASFRWLGSTGPLWFAEALIVFCLVYALVRKLRPRRHEDSPNPPSTRTVLLIILGVLHWRSFAFAFWESFIAIGFSIGIIAFFKKYLDVENAATRFLAANAFGVYLFHPPILISISLFFRNWHAGLFAKHLVVAPLAFAASLLFSALVRRIPIMRRILK